MRKTAFYPWKGRRKEKELERKTALVLAIVLLLATVSMAYATVLYTLQKPMTVTVAGSDGELQLYSSSSLDMVVNSVDFGMIGRGTSKNSTVMYLKNAGAKDVSVMWNCLNLPSGFTVKAYFGPAASQPNNLWTSGISLLAGTVCTVKFEISVDTSTTSKAYSWTVQFQSNS